MDVQNQSMLFKLIVALFLVMGVSAVVVFVLYIKIYYRLTRGVKLEILTINTPKDLYENEHFRPYLNLIYYKHSQ
jgi:hypothetical protein